jgi:WD domain, G-beta repeat
VVNPYDWLGIPAESRPPSHYQLLGLDPSVTDTADIRAAADRQLRRLMPHVTGPEALAAEQLWTELEEARDTLLDADRRALYDATIVTSPSNEAVQRVEAMDPAAPDISAFEEPPPESTPSGAVPWWKASPEPAPAPANQWWKQPLPEEAIAPPPPAPVALAQAHIATMPLPSATVPDLPRVRPRPTALLPDPLPMPRQRRRQSSTIAVAFASLFIVGMIAGGVYYAFGRKVNSATTKPETTPEIVKNDPKPQPVDDPGPVKVEEPVVSAAPLPKNFADQLRPRTFTGHAGAVSAIAVERSGSRFATAGTDRTVRLWSVLKDGGQIRHSFTSPAVGVAWANKDAILVAADGFTIGLLDPQKSKPVRGLDSPRGGVTVMAVTPDGRRVLTGLTDGYLRLWDADAGRFDEWPAAARGPVVAVDLTADGKKALASVQDGSVSYWNTSTRSQPQEWNPHPGGAIALQFSPDGTRAATAGPDGTASIYDLTERKELCRIVGHVGPVTGIAWFPGGRQLVTVGVDGTARLWNAETGQPVRWMQTLSGKGMCVAVDPGERFVLTGTSTGIVQLFPLPRVRGEVVAGPPAEPPAEPLAIPDPEAVATAMSAVRTELAKEYTYNRPDDISVLADNLRRRAGSPRVSTPLRYGLLQEARTLAIKAADAPTAFRAVEDLALWFDVDELAEKAATLATIPSDADPTAVVATGLVAAERAETDARFELMNALLSRLPEPAGLPPDLATRLAALRQRAAAAAAERKVVGRALELLKNAPDDQKGNQTVGLYLCQARQDWANGLPYLAKGAEPRLVEAAKLDLSAPNDPKVQHRLGEMWYIFANEARDHRAKRAYLGRARVWFERETKAKLEVTDAIKARARLDDVNRLDVPSKDATTLPLFTPVVMRRAYNTTGADVLATEWGLESGAVAKAEGVFLAPGTPLIRSKFGIAPGGRLTLSLRPDGREVRLNVAGQEVAFAGAGKSLRIAIERKDDTVTLTAVADEGEPVARTVDLAAAARGPTPLTIRLTGMPTQPDGAILASAIARGLISLAPPTPE